MTMPDFLIIGAPKAGTTAVKHTLQAHRNIFIPDVPKEPHFFSFASEGWPSWATKTSIEYQSLFEGCREESLIGEKSTWYLYCAGAPALIAKAAPDCKAIAILRNPIDRAHSHWLFNRQMGWDAVANFGKAVESESKRSRTAETPDQLYVGAGRYAEQLDRWVATLGWSKIHVVIYDDLVRHPERSYRELLRFLELPVFVPGVAREQHNQTSGVRWYGLRNLVQGARPVTKYVPSSLKHRLGKKIFSVNRGATPALDLTTARQVANILRDDVYHLSEMLDRDLIELWLKRFD